ncbi:CPCC family cysteine-rich protein [Clostridium sp. Marseille-Q2269]|uniref:CPCC family cysteine-rich protein n=1 Tax=Clostridium sp. Marseille-Q2269 TaxID=2942205 RepID=UPI002072D3E6|nr:CPCC family cysteine-rich protein [Clostridium sp. Marseille-Q2269]
MDRIKAITIICKNELTMITKEKREELLINWWQIDSEDTEFQALPEILQTELLESDEPCFDVMNTRYNPLLIEALKYEFIGVKNEYLSKKISVILRKEITVEGQPESLSACPCCQYKTLKERGQYKICPVCFWEDDGNDEPSRYSSANRMTLEQGRTNFINYGIVIELGSSYIKTDSKERYYKESIG